MKVLHVVGARPNFMKIAPLLRALEPHDVEQVLVHTGQHYDESMSASFFRELGIREPDVNLGVGSGSHTAQTADVMKAFEPVLERVAPDVVVVVGDVNSTLACTLVAAKANVPVAHVEAGLRSRDRSMPEEINRLVTDRIADLLLTPSRDADRNLIDEGVEPERIRFVGNIMIDSLLRQLESARALDLAASFGVERRGYTLATLHRPSNVDDPAQLGEIFDALAALASERPLILPLHPRTRASAERHRLLGKLGAVRVAPPLGYTQMLALLDAAALVITDSGGIQEETTALGVPCITLRDSTERPITVTEGTNVLVPVRTRTNILAAARDAERRPSRIPEFWDGRTAARIAEALLERYGSVPMRADVAAAV